jgi:hypothetical protein
VRCSSGTQASLKLAPGSLRGGQRCVVSPLRSRSTPRFHPDQPVVSRVLLESPPVSGFSKEYGESALVLYDKGRNPQAARCVGTPHIAA